MLAWWFSVLASTSTTSNLTNSAGGVNEGLFSLLDPANRMILYKLLSHRFNLLYKSFVESRKAFRMGRTFIEYDKLRSMGWGEYFVGMLRDPIGDGVGRSAGGASWRKGSENEERLLKAQYPTHSIPEHYDEDNTDHEGDESWNEDEDEKKMDPPPKVVARPGRPHLPSRVSSNIGWGPGTSASERDDSTEVEEDAGKCPPKRTVSELGAMYKSSRSSSLGWVKKTGDAQVTKTSEATPAWKLIGSTLKLIGLMGFWTFDNLAFLTGTGFLDPFSLSSNGSNANSDHKSLRMQRKKRASEWGARFYFMGSVAGLIVNSKSVWENSNGALRNAREELKRCVYAQSATTASEEVTTARQQLKKAELKHFELYVALLKSICDCIVFSNNPGVDLHLKYRGKKNHEGFHCCCGLVSAGTVLFGNFPNA
jgi:hypothetical protein